MLESAWRIKNWTEHRETLEEQINQLPDIGTPHRRVFEAFIALLKLLAALDKKILEDAMQLSLRKWVSLPSTQSSVAHIPLLQHYQQFVELQEVVQIFGSLSTTTAQNLEKKLFDLKMALQAWRERLLTSTTTSTSGVTWWHDGRTSSTRSTRLTTSLSF
jgi:transformation/transcription domain-associated protein